MSDTTNTLAASILALTQQHCPHVDASAATADPWPSSKRPKRWLVTVDTNDLELEVEVDFDASESEQVDAIWKEVEGHQQAEMACTAERQAERRFLSCDR